MSVLEVRGLSVSYGGRTVLSEVDLDVHAGRVTALIGPSGCGKTSFLYSLNRLTDLVEGCEVRGDVRFEGRPITGRGVDVVALRRAIGTVFQEPNPFPLSVRENLRLPLREHGHRGVELERVIDEALREVGLAEELTGRLDEPAVALSGGQKQRLCIARALALRPKVILMDEPCSALDPVATEKIEGLIDRLRAEYAIVVVTHNLAQARRIADDVAVFWVRDGCGRRIESGPAARVFEAPSDPDTRAYLAGRLG